MATILQIVANTTANRGQSWELITLAAQASQGTTKNGDRWLLKPDSVNWLKLRFARGEQVSVRQPMPINALNGLENASTDSRTNYFHRAIVFHEEVWTCKTAEQIHLFTRNFRKTERKFAVCFPFREALEQWLTKIEITPRPLVEAVFLSDWIEILVGLKSHAAKPRVSIFPRADDTGEAMTPSGAISDIQGLWEVRDYVLARAALIKPPSK